MTASAPVDGHYEQEEQHRIAEANDAAARAALANLDPKALQRKRSWDAMLARIDESTRTFRHLVARHRYFLMVPGGGQVAAKLVPAENLEQLETRVRDEGENYDMLEYMTQVVPRREDDKCDILVVFYNKSRFMLHHG